MDELTPLVDKLSFLQQDLANEKQMNERLTREIEELCQDMCMKKLEVNRIYFHLFWKCICINRNI